MDKASLMALVETGIDEIDGEHQRIIECLSSVIDATASCASVDRVLSAVVDLKSSCERHFGTEEAFMLKIRYSETMTHVKLHADNIAHVDRIINLISDTGRCPDSKVFMLMATWLHEHMRTMDMDLAEAILRYRKKRRR